MPMRAVQRPVVRSSLFSGSEISAAGLTGPIGNEGRVCHYARDVSLRVMQMKAVTLPAAMLLTMALASTSHAKTTRFPQTIDAAVAAAMSKTGARGLAIAVIDHGRVRYVQAYGVRDKAGRSLADGHCDVWCLAY